MGKERREGLPPRTPTPTGGMSPEPVTTMDSEQSLGYEDRKRMGGGLGSVAGRLKSRFARGSSKGSMDMHVEVDPTGRYTRSTQVLGKGSSKIVYKGFDRQTGTEVAWNEVKIPGNLTARNRDRLLGEVDVLKRLRHKNIMKFYASWIDEQQQALYFITEYFHPGPLRRHRRAHKCMQRNVLKSWAWQILQGLVYLHGHSPPIIHRDLKCDNIFIHGVTGEVKIGDLGLAKLMEESIQTCQSVLGTPEFMAPELYHGKYNEKVDIYAYGMCLLELVSMQFPYLECRNRAQIFRNVSMGIYPQALMKIEDDETRGFIELCIDFHHERRPYARELLKHSFFNDVRPAAPKPTGPPGHMRFKTDTNKSEKKPVRKEFKIQRGDIIGSKLNLKMSIITAGVTKVVMFSFDMECDTVDAVATELRDEFELSKEEVLDFSDILRTEVEQRIMEERRDTVQNIKEALGPLDDFPQALQMPNVFPSESGNREQDTDLHDQDKEVPDLPLPQPLPLNSDHSEAGMDEWSKKPPLVERELDSTGVIVDGKLELARTEERVEDDVALVPFWVAGTDPGRGTVYLQGMDGMDGHILEVNGKVAENLLPKGAGGYETKASGEKPSVVYIRVAKATSPTPQTMDRSSTSSSVEKTGEGGGSLKAFRGYDVPERNIPDKVVQFRYTDPDATCWSSFWEGLFSWCCRQPPGLARQPRSSRFKETKSFANVNVNGNGIPPANPQQKSPSARNKAAVESMWKAHPSQVAMLGTPAVQ